MKIILPIIIVLFSCFSGSAQDSATFHLKTAIFTPEIGASYVQKYESYLLGQSFQSEVNSQVVVFTGFNLQFNILKEKKVFPSVSAGMGSLRTRVKDADTNYLSQITTFKNRFFSWKLEALINVKLQINGRQNQLSLGGYYDEQIFLYLFGRYPFMSVWRFIPYNGPNNFGIVAGWSTVFKNHLVGIFLNQRLYYSGFNREISRLTLRVSF